MSTVVMETQAAEARTGEARPGFAKTLMPHISWGAVLGGLAAGSATFFLLALFGTATGLTAVDPQAAEPVGSVPIFAGIWTGISMLAGSFVGAYVAARMSGMSRRTDGILHGFVAWGVSTIFFVYLVTAGIGALLGGTFAVLGQGVQAAGSAAGDVAASPTAQQQIEELIPGSPGAAQQIEGEQAAATAVEGLTRASWFLFTGVLLSLIAAIGGGFLGAKAVLVRRNPLHSRAEKGK